MERTLVLIKPDGVQRGLVGEIISRLDRRALKLVALKLMQVNETLARLHYVEHLEQPFFRGLVDFITSAPLVAMVWEADNVVDIVRRTMGETDPVKSAPGTVRGDLGLDIGRNLVHGSDCLESAQREVSLFFSPKEIFDYTRAIEPWIKES
jgi:nucleoside-diphosphate kinase